MCDLKNITIIVKKLPELLNYTVLRNGHTQLTGIDGKYLQLMLDFLGLDVNFLNLHEHQVNEIESGMADALFNGIIFNESGFQKYATSMPHRIFFITFAMKKSMPLKTRFAFLYAFGLNTWLVYLASFILLPFIAFFLLDYKLSYIDLIFHMIGCLLRQSLKLPMKSFRRRLFILFFLFFTMVVSFSYSAVFFSFMVNPLKIPPVRNFRELSTAVSSNKRKCVFNLGYESHVFLNSSVSYLRSLYKESEEELWFQASEKRFEQVLSKGNAIVIGDTFLNLKFGMNPEVFLADDRIAPTMLSLLFRKNFCLKDRINTFILRAWSAGLYIKLIKEAQMKKFISLRELNTVNTPKPLNLHDISGILIILLLGYVLSLFALAIEIIMSKYEMYRYGKKL